MNKILSFRLKKLAVFFIQYQCYIIFEFLLFCFPSFGLIYRSQTYIIQLRIMNQKQLAKKFLEAIFILDKNTNTNKQLEFALQTLSQIDKYKMPLNQNISSRLFLGLAINYKSILNKSLKQIDLITTNEAVQEYLIIKFTNGIKQFLENHSKLLKIEMQSESFIIILSTCVQNIKFREKQILNSILQLVKAQTAIIKNRLYQKSKIEQILPSVLSTTFNTILNQYKQKKNVKCKYICFEIIEILLSTYFNRFQQFILKNYLNPLNKDKNFRQVCIENLKKYFQVLYQNLQQLGFTNYNRVKQFISNLLSNQFIHVSDLLPIMYKLAYAVQLDLQIQKQSENHQPIIINQLKIQLFNQLKSLSKGDLVMNTEQLAKRLNLINRIIKIQNLSTTYDQSQILFNFIKKMLRVKPNLKIRLTLNSTIIQFEKLNEQSRLTIETQNSFKTSYQKIKQNHLLNSIPFFNSQNIILNLVEEMLKKVCYKIKINWIQLLLQFLENRVYDFQMNIKQLCEYLTMMYILNQILKNLQNIDNRSRLLVQKIFKIIRKTQCLFKLKVSYQEQELLVIILIEILYNTYQLLISSQQDLPFYKFNCTILIVQIIIGLLNQQIYAITLLCSLILLTLSDKKCLAQFLEPMLPTIIARNSNYVTLIATLLNLSNINSHLAQQIAEKYYLIQNSQQIIFKVIPLLPTNLVRKCLLACTKNSRWIEGLFKSADYLNNKTMINDSIMKAKDYHFLSNDGENVTISNCLGVLVMEIDNKWQQQLKGKKCGRVLQLLIKLYEINSNLIFFRRLKQFFTIFNQILQKYKQNIASTGLSFIIEKLLILLNLYFSNENLKSIKVDKDILNVLFVNFQEISRKIKIQFYRKLKIEIPNYDLLARIVQNIQKIINNHFNNQ